MFFLARKIRLRALLLQPLFHFALGAFPAPQEISAFLPRRENEPVTNCRNDAIKRHIKT
ncbi:hypothetical protein GKC28_23020 [Leisingera sp. ANG59]|nr:hypothetical protein [Leisingera sp. ANG59]